MSFIFAAFILTTIMQLVIIVLTHLRLALYSPKQTTVNQALKPISIIICAKNEIVNLKANLPFILAQDYPNFEVIVVDDDSTDGSDLYLNSLKKKRKI